jgi:hypothetical protein
MPSRLPLRDSSRTLHGCIERNSNQEKGDAIYIELVTVPDDVHTLMSNEDSQMDVVKYAFACNPKVSDLLRRKAARHEFTLFPHCAATYDGHVTHPVSHDDVIKDVSIPSIHFSDWLRNTVAPNDRVLVRTRYNAALLRHLVMEGTLCLIDELNIIDSGAHDTEFCQVSRSIEWMQGAGCNVKLVGAKC